MDAPLLAFECHILESIFYLLSYHFFLKVKFLASCFTLVFNKGRVSALLIKKGLFQLDPERIGNLSVRHPLHIFRSLGTRPSTGHLS